MPQRQVRDIADRVCVRCWIFSEHLDRRVHFAEDAVHLTAEGRLVAAQEIGRVLKSAGLLPEARARANR